MASAAFAGRCESRLPGSRLSPFRLMLRALLAIFLPSFLLVIGVLPYWTA